MLNIKCKIKTLSFNLEYFQTDNWTKYYFLKNYDACMSVFLSPSLRVGVGSVRFLSQWDSDTK